MADSSKEEIKELQKRIADLERIVEQKQLNIDFLDKMIEIAEDQYGVDIKKTSIPHHHVVQRKHQKIRMFTSFEL
jgi:DNA gyrase/topoisomerase IV subunit A